MVIRAQMCLFLRMAEWSWAILTSPKLRIRDLCTHKPALHTTRALKYGKISHTDKRAIYGRWDEWCFKQRTWAFRSRRVICKRYFSK